jgi:putative membrane protein
MYMARTVPLVLAIVALLGACGPGASSHNTTMTAGGDVSASPPTDAEILAVLSEANTAEIDAANTALARSGSADVKAFARAMIADHTTLLNGGTLLADSLDVPPQPPADDSLTAHFAKEKQALLSATAATFDRTYMDAQVEDHQTVLLMLQRFENQARHRRLKALIAQVEAVVQDHLARAQTVEAKVTSATA